MNKRQIRQYIRQIAQLVSANERKASAANILSQIESTEEFATSHTIALFIGLPDEVPTLEWIERWQAAGKRILIPRVVGDDMEFYAYEQTQLCIGAYGILEPTSGNPVEASAIDLMILPGVAFCTDGRRLGRGKGYYDRYLAREGFRAFTIGVGYAHQLLKDIPCEEHDKMLNRVVTSRVTSPTPQIIRRIVESADKDAKRLGCGLDRLIPMGYSWVLLRFKMELIRTPEADEKLNIETWIDDCSRVTTTRNFIVRDQDGLPLGEAVSQWCMIDIHKRTPIDLHSSAVNYQRLANRREGALRFTKKIVQIDQDSTELESTKHIASAEDLDFNQHVNTFRYIDMMLGMLPSSRLSKRGRCSIDIQFIKECYLGEELTIIHQKIETDGAAANATTPLYHFEILHPDGKCAVRAMFQLE